MDQIKLGQAEKVTCYTLVEDHAPYPFWGQHGISFLLEIETDGVKRRILFDTGSHPKPLLHNMEELTLKPKNIDMIVLSHSHYDHTGGLVKIMEELNQETPIFAHPNIFKTSFHTEPTFRYTGIPPLRGGSKRKIEELGGTWILTKDPIKIMHGAAVLGEITKEDKTSFEKDATLELSKLEDGHIVPDELEDELGMALRTQKGLVVVAGCSHPGIASMVKKAMEISKMETVHAVIGGFHLVDADEQRIGKTVRSLREVGVEEVYTGHCTGLKGEERFMDAWKDNFELLHAGKVITL